MFHTTAWLIWLLSGVAPALMISNPLYLALLLFASVVNYRILARRSEMAPTWQPLLRIALVVVLLATLFNLLFAHGGRTVLFTLPSWQLLVGPDRRIALLTLGGPVALEAVAYGLTRAAALMMIILMFATFNMLVDTAHLMRSLPRFMYQTGVVTSIAVSFVPQSVLALREIREAQMVRGHEFRGVRDLLPLFMPLMTTGMERALQLAESMEARGFGARREVSAREEVLYKSLVAVALALAVAAMAIWGFAGRSRWIALVLGAAVAGLLAGVFRSMSRRVNRTRYVRELWRRRDTLLTALSVLSLAIVLGAKQLGGAFMYYYPYPLLRWPGFEPLVGVALLLFVSPVILLGPARSPRKVGMQHD